MHEIELTGLDGANLLGYLAALGTLRVLTLADPEAEVRMRWTDAGWWTPVVHHSRVGSREELVAVLARSVPSEAFSRDYLDSTLEDFRKELLARAQDPKQREAADFLAALGSDCFAERRDGDTPATTEFRAIGAGNNQGFLGFMRTIHMLTSGEHLHRALFAEWDYSDPPPFMRWDPNEYRPHALRADDPAKDRAHNNVRGANRLAIEALPLFPTVPGRGQLHTAAFRDRDGQTEISWPIWTEPLNQDTVGSLLASEDIQKAERSAMRHRGIAQIFRARRFTEGRYRNFSPAKADL